MVVDVWLGYCVVVDMVVDVWLRYCVVVDVVVDVWLYMCGCESAVATDARKRWVWMFGCTR